MFRRKYVKNMSDDPKVYHSQRLAHERRRVQSHLSSIRMTATSARLVGDYDAWSSLERQIQSSLEELAIIDTSITQISVPSSTKPFGSAAFSSKKVTHAPGHFAHLILSFLFFKKEYEAHFAQAIADMREEVFDCDQNNQEVRRWYILGVSYVGILISVGMYLSIYVGKKITTIWRTFGG